MILLTILIIALLAVAITALIATVVSGTGVLLLFGDLIVFVLIIWLIIKLFRRKR